MMQHTANDLIHNGTIRQRIKADKIQKQKEIRSVAEV